MDWDPGFHERSPIFEPLRAHAVDVLCHGDWPSLESLQRLTTTRSVITSAGAPLQLVSEGVGDSYEARIRLRAEMHVRERNWHDLFNVLVWLTYPLTKAALNDAHFAAWLHEQHRAERARAGRGPVRDALTLFDENGLIVLSADRSLLDDLRAFRWKRLFWRRRKEVLASMRFLAFGHALLEKALHPYVGMTAHALLLSVNEDALPPLANALATADALASAAVRSISTPRSLSPVPVLGIPGWWTQNETPAFYDNTDYFRTGRRQS